MNVVLQSGCDREKKKQLGGAKKSKREIKTEGWGVQFSFFTLCASLSFFLPKEKNSDYLIGGIKFSQAPCWLRPTSLKLPANKHQKPGSINEADVLISHLWAAKQLSSTSPSIALSSRSPSFILTELLMIFNAPQAVIGPTGRAEIQRFVWRI